MIKLAIIIDTIESPTAGTEKQILLLLKYLDRKMFSPILCVLRTSEWLEKEFNFCPIYKIRINSLISINCLIKLVLFVFFLKKEKIDIVQCYFKDSDLFGPISAKIAGIKMIIGARRNQGYALDNFYMKIRKFVNRWITYFLANSNSTKEWLIKTENIHEEKIIVQHNMLDIEAFKCLSLENKKEYRRLFGFNDNVPVVGIVANLRPIKGIDVFLKAAFLIKRDLPDTQFVVVGEGEQRIDLEKMVSDLNLKDNVHFLGRREDIPMIINSFDVGVLSSYSESFSNSVIEYIAARIPAICTDVGGVREIIIDGVNGYIIKVGDYKELAKKIVAVLNDNSKSSNKRTDKNFFEKFSITEKINDYQQIILHNLRNYSGKQQDNNPSTIKAFILNSDIIKSTNFIYEWEEMLKNSQSLYIQYCSPTWFNVLTKAKQSNVKLIGAYNNNFLCGLLIYSVEQKTIYWGPPRLGLKQNLKVCTILGDILSRNADVERIFDVALDVFPKNMPIFLKSFPITSKLWNSKNLSLGLSKKYNILLELSRPLYKLKIPSSIQDYYSFIGSKKKWQLKKKGKIISQELSGEIRLLRFSLTEEVDEFVCLSLSILKQAWQNEKSIEGAYLPLKNKALLIAAAEEKILRCYVLKCGQEPCAFVIGYQYGGIYHYADVAYDKRIEKGSPGLVTLNLLIQDLITYNRPNVLNFGIGVARYKSEFSDEFIEDRGAILFPKSLKGKAFIIINEILLKLSQYKIFFNNPNSTSKCNRRVSDF